MPSTSAVRVRLPPQCCQRAPHQFAFDLGERPPDERGDRIHGRNHVGRLGLRGHFAAFATSAGGLQPTPHEFAGDHGAVAEQSDALHDVLQFAHVAGPFQSRSACSALGVERGPGRRKCRASGTISSLALAQRAAGTPARR
jgi:hypothetical protein